jgi:antitoxin (DNA-binding transcriptional repressor) of toxin-antitoxin stability system
MKSATVRDLRYRFAEIESRLRQEETIEIRKRKQVLGRLIPVQQKASAYPGFTERALKIFGNRVLSLTVADLVSLRREE